MARRKQRKAEQFKQSWERFFESTAPPADRPLDSQERISAAKVSAVRQQHEADLLKHPHVVGVGVGYRMKGGRPTKELCITVFVDQKLPVGKLRPEEILPREIDGVKVDVVETGPVEILPK